MPIAFFNDFFGRGREDSFDCIDDCLGLFYYFYAALGFISISSVRAFGTYRLGKLLIDYRCYYSYRGRALGAFSAKSFFFGFSLFDALGFKKSG